jgi:hypothetical protein
VLLAASRNPHRLYTDWERAELNYPYLNLVLFKLFKFVRRLHVEGGEKHIDDYKGTFLKVIKCLSINILNALPSIYSRAWHPQYLWHVKYRLIQWSIHCRVELRLCWCAARNKKQRNLRKPWVWNQKPAIGSYKTNRILAIQIYRNMKVFMLLRKQRFLISTEKSRLLYCEVAIFVSSHWTASRSNFKVSRYSGETIWTSFNFCVSEINLYRIIEGVKIPIAMRGKEVRQYALFQTYLATRRSNNFMLSYYL